MKIPPLKNTQKAQELIVNGNAFHQASLPRPPLRYGDIMAEQRQREELIMQAIRKGKQTSLINSKNLNQSQFENDGNIGPLAVFTEELHSRNIGNPCKSARKHRLNDWVISISLGDIALKGIKHLKGRRGLMLDGEPSGDRLPYKAENVHNIEPFQTELKLPKLKSQESYSNDVSLQYSKNTELPKLPAQEYIDNFRRDAAEFERSLQCIGRGGKSVRRRSMKGKIRDSILPKIDEKLTMSSTNATNKFLTRDDQFRLPKLHHKKEDNAETVSKKKRKSRNNEQNKTTDHHSRYKMSHSERKAALQKEQAKWCKTTFQSNAYI